MISLSQHISEKYNGSQVEFARANGIDKQTVWRMLQKGYWYVYEGKLLAHKRDVV